MKTRTTILATAVALSMTGFAPVHAGDKVNDYVTDGSGKIVRDGSGDCVRQTSKTTVKLEECGYKVEVVAKKTPMQAEVSVVKEKVVLERVVIQNLQFAFDSAALTDADKGIHNTAVDQLTPYKESFRNQTSYVEIKGYTESSGPEDYNMKLSQRRADSVADYLTNALGADRSRMKVMGMGEANPVADNSTREGRILNRRVEVEVIQN